MSKLVEKLYTLPNVITHIHKVFDAKGYLKDPDKSDMCIVGVRSNNPDTVYYNDAMIVMIGDIRYYIYPITTTPSNKTLKDPVNKDGCAILCEGQHVGMWQDGLHKGYPALVQATPVPVYRDNNRDDKLDFNGDIQTGLFGINCHRNSAVQDRVEIGLYSAGCQVHAHKNSFELFHDMVVKQYGKNKITYTLIKESDIDNLFNIKL